MSLIPGKMQQPSHNLAFKAGPIAPEDQRHQPVLVQEVLAHLAPRDEEIFIDGTVGAGGHSWAILASSARVRVVGVDRDETALELARARLGGYGARFRAIHADFRRLADLLGMVGLSAVDGILVDLGVSSLQLEQAQRGFSFRLEGPLDMRLDRQQSLTAWELVNRRSEAELADIIYQYGEERAARRIARAIVRQRRRQPIETTTQLADIVTRAAGATRRGRLHPATRTFQALRIAVNDELKDLDRFVTTAIDALNPGGRLVVISFHSLEDRIIKRAFRLHAGQCQCSPPMPLPGDVRCPRCGARRRVEILTRKPVRPTQAEVTLNPRARSAKLRACRRLGAAEMSDEGSA